MWSIRVSKELPEVDNGLFPIIPAKWFRGGMYIIYGTKYNNIRVERILSAIVSIMADRREAVPILLSDVRIFLYEKGSHLILQDPDFDNYIGKMQEQGDIDLVRVSEAIYIVPRAGLKDVIFTSISAQDHTPMDT